jgi:hypothetical protein
MKHISLFDIVASPHALRDFVGCWLLVVGDPWSFVNLHSAIANRHSPLVIRQSSLIIRHPLIFILQSSIPKIKTTECLK